MLAFVFYVGPDPADVLAAPKAPVLEAERTQVQTVAGAAPQEDETLRRGHFRNIQRHNLVPVPEFNVGDAVAAAVLFKRRLDQDDVKLGI